MALNTHVEIPLPRLLSRPFVLQAGRHTGATTQEHGNERQPKSVHC